MTATFISISNTSALLIVILSLIGVVLEIFDYFGYYNFYLDVRFSTEELMATGKYTEEQVEKFNLEWRKSSDKEKIKKYNNWLGVSWYKGIDLVKVTKLTFGVTIAICGIVIIYVHC
jgi:hypothetical protein